MTAMFSKVWIINLVLAALIVFCWIKIWDGPDAELIIPVKTGTAEKTGPAPSKVSIAAARPGSSLEYENIVEMNLFSPERTFVPKPAEAGPDQAVVEDEVRVSGEKVVLYGVVVLDDVKKALINNPARKPGDRDFLWVTEGERLSNLLVTRIDPEQLLLNDGSAQYRIGLHDPGKPRSPASSSRPASRQRDVPQVISADPAPAQPPAARAGAGTGASPAPPKRRASETRKETVAADDDDEYEIVDTPFGAFRRKKTK